MNGTETKARIIQLLAESMLTDLERVKRHHDSNLAPLPLLLAGAALAAALIGAGVAMTKWITG